MHIPASLVHNLDQLYRFCVCSHFEILPSSGNTQLMAMGNNQFRQQVTWTGTDSDEEDFDLSVLRSTPAKSIRSVMETDAVGSSTDAVPRKDLGNQDILRDIENQLLDYEKVSLIYLLFDSPTISLEMMTQVVEGKKINLLEKFIRNNPNCPNKIIEALTIIQNYHVLKMFGQSKTILNARFYPLERRTSLYISKFKKYFYRMFEDMTAIAINNFLDEIAKDFATKGLQFIKYKHLEMYFVYFQSIHYINQDNFENIEKILKQTDFDKYEDMTVSFPKERRCSFSTAAIKTADIYKNVEKYEDKSDRKTCEINMDKAQPSSSLFTARTESSPNILLGSNCYDINPDHPGVVLIIENEHFYGEMEEKYLRLTMNTRRKIETRTGTEHDRLRLEKTFTLLGFKVETATNLPHFEILQFVRSWAHDKVKPEHSSLFVCVLSHGVEGKIIASNSVPLEVREIKKLMCSPVLEGKPKVLILQSCQGDEVQKLNIEVEPEISYADYLTTDGLTSKVPRTSDFLEIWSTVPGYASIRSTIAGSWFIQSLCDVIDKHQELDLVAMCTYVQSEIRNRKWIYEEQGQTEIRVMVPETRTTLSKFLYLPQPKATINN